MRICYKREWNAHADRITSKNSAKLKQYYYFYAEFLEEIRYIILCALILYIDTFLMVSLRG